MPSAKRVVRALEGYRDAVAVLTRDHWGSVSLTILLPEEESEDLYTPARSVKLYDDEVKTLLQFLNENLWREGNQNEG